MGNKVRAVRIAGAGLVGAGIAGIGTGVLSELVTAGPAAASGENCLWGANGPSPLSVGGLCLKIDGHARYTSFISGSFGGSGPGGPETGSGYVNIHGPTQNPGAAGGLSHNGGVGKLYNGQLPAAQLRPNRNLSTGAYCATLYKKSGKNYSNLGSACLNVTS